MIIKLEGPTLAMRPIVGPVLPGVYTVRGETDGQLVRARFTGSQWVTTNAGIELHFQPKAYA